jgi:transposase
VRWLCLRPPDQLEPHERDALADILDDDERLAAGYDLLQRFRQLIARRSVRDMAQWLVDAAESGLRPFASLARPACTSRARTQFPAGKRVAAQFSCSRMGRVG